MEAKKFCENVEKYQNDMYVMAYAILRNETDAEDAVSNAILKAYENIGKLRSLRKMRAWLLVITKNEALLIKRKRLFLPGDETVQSYAKPVEAHYDELWDVLGQMKEEYRLVVVLFYYQGLPIKTIAEVLELPEGTVKSRLSRGKEELRKALERGDKK